VSATVRSRSRGRVAGVLAVVLAATAVFAVAAPTSAQSVPSDGEAMVIATKPLEPFVRRDEAGKYTGFSVDLWDEIADRNGWRYEWQWHETVKDVLASVEAEKADAGIAGITITKAREQTLDFSHAMFNSGLQVAVTKSKGEGLLASIGNIFASRLFKLLGILAVCMVVAGNVLWLTKFRRRPETRKYLDGVSAGVWFAGKTLGSADFGDEEPRRPLGRMLALGWMFAGIIFIQYFTALTTSQLTAERLESSIRGVQDLPGKEIVTVAGTTADTWLKEQGLPHRTVTKIEEAYPLLLDGRVDAIVYDSPVLLRWVATAGQGRALIAGSIFKPEQYGIAMPQGSALREKVNGTLLEMQADGTYDEIVKRWFG
jgi:polar amino acid transport system substrate-binding protein